MTGSATIDLRGIAARTITVGSGEPLATIESDAWSFVRWITQRGMWEDFDVSVTGDDDSIAIMRQLHVF